MVFDCEGFMKELVRGDYVLATKWNDGDVHDNFVVGFYDGKDGDRYYVVDVYGNQFRQSGFRRCERVSEEVGELIVMGMELIERCSASIWYWKYHPKTLRKLISSGMPEGLLFVFKEVEV